jgi:putative ABC transport system permease protein
MDLLLKDVRFALRKLAHQRAFTVTAVATLSLAIGISAAIFSIVESTLLRRLPFEMPDRLAMLWGAAGTERAIRGASVIEIQDWGRLSKSYDDVAIYDETSLNYRTSEGTERVEAEMVSASYWRLLGARAQLGRTFTIDEDRVPNAHAVVTISDAMWRTRFGADPTIIGRTLVLNEIPFTVVGVMQPEFAGLSFDTDVWFPAMMVQANGGPRDLSNRGNRWLGAVARVKDGVSFEEAQQDADRVALQIAQEFPNTNADRWVEVQPLRDSYLGSTENLVLVVFSAVVLLLVIATANVLGLQIVRATGRSREMAVRLAVGANRSRLLQQLTIEGLVLSLLATIVGITVAHWGLEGLLRLVPDGVLPRYATPAINWQTLAFAIGVALVSGTLFGLVPALRSTRVDLVDSLRDGARASAGGFGRPRANMQQLLVIAQTSVAIVLLIGAGLFVRSLQRELEVPPGFAAEGALRVRVVMPQQLTAANRQALSERLHQELGVIPSVRAVAIGSDVPLGGSSSAAFIYVPDLDQRYRYYRHSVMPDFFSALRIPLVDGRAFNAEDRAESPPVVVINQSTARRFWPNEGAIGKRIRLGDASAPEVTVVGVVGDVRYRDLRTPLSTSEPDVYFPMAQRPASAVQIAIRSDLPVENLTNAVQRAVAGIDPALTVFGARDMQEILELQTANGRLASSLLTVFGVAALLLAAVGLYGLLAFVVSLRSREIGIRLALGATQRNVLREVIGHGLRLVAVGLTVGVAIAALTTRYVESQLFAVGRFDPLVFAMATLALFIVALVASWIPARRASRVHPQVAIRAQ